MSRPEEWQDPTALPTDTNFEAFCDEAIETIAMPEINALERKRLTGWFAEVTGYDVAIPTKRLPLAIRTQDTDGQGQKREDIKSGPY